MGKKSVSEIALKDIADSQKGIIEPFGGANWETWVVSASNINTKETRKLNKELGLNKINKKS